MRHSELELLIDSYLTSPVHHSVAQNACVSISLCSEGKRSLLRPTQCMEKAKFSVDMQTDVIVFKVRNL